MNVPHKLYFPLFALDEYCCRQILDALNLRNCLAVCFCSMERLLERYERHTYAEKAMGTSDPESQVEIGSILSSIVMHCEFWTFEPHFFIFMVACSLF